MNRTAKSGEIKIIKIHNEYYISSNDTNIRVYSSLEHYREESNDKILEDTPSHHRLNGDTLGRARILIRIDHISHIENYKGTIKLIMNNGMCYVHEGFDLEIELANYGFDMKGN